MIYLITKPNGKAAYYSFRRLLKEERIEDMVKKTGEAMPDKDNLPVRLIHRQILIEEIEVDERL